MCFRNLLDDGFDILYFKDLNSRYLRVSRGRVRAEQEAARLLSAADAQMYLAKQDGGGGFRCDGCIPAAGTGGSATPLRHGEQLLRSVLETAQDAFVWPFAAVFADVLRALLPGLDRDARSRCDQPA